MTRDLLTTAAFILVGLLIYRYHRAIIGMYGGGGYSSGNFFDFIFGSPHSNPQPIYRPRPRVNGRITQR